MFDNTINESITSEFIDEKMSKDLLARLLIFTDTKITDLRLDTKKSIVMGILSDYNPEDIFTIAEIQRRINDIMKCDISQEELIGIFEELVGKNILVYVSDLKYKLIIKINSVTFSSLTESVWQEFDTYLKKNDPDYDVFLDKGTKQIFDSILFHLLMKISSFSEDLDLQIESLEKINLQETIEFYVKQPGLSTNTAKKMPKILESYLLANQPALKDFLFKAYSSLVRVHITLHEHNLPAINILENIHFLILDTTFLVSLSCKTDPRNGITLAIIQKCSKLNIPLYFTSRTKEEMEYLIRGSINEMSGLSSNNPHEVIQNQFVQDFSRLGSIDPDMGWDDYCVILNEWKTSFSNQYNVKELPDSIPYSVDKDTEAYIIDTLNLVSHIKYRSEAQIYHDAYCLGIVKNLRQSYKKENDESPLGPWFVTFDNHVATADEFYQKKFGHAGLVIQPRSLLNYFIAFSKIEFDDDDKKHVIESILKYSLAYTSRHITIDEYSRLVTYKVGLTKYDINVVKKLILSHPLINEIKRALAIGRGDIAEETIWKIVSDSDHIDKVLENRRLREQIKELAKDKNEIQTKFTEMKIRYETLRENLTFFDERSKTKFLALIDILKGEDIFERKIIELPPENPTKEKIVYWLKSGKEAIETSETYSRLLPIVIPIFTELLKHIN